MLPVWLFRSLGVLGVATVALNAAPLRRIWTSPHDNNPLAIVFVAGLWAGVLPCLGLFVRQAPRPTAPLIVYRVSAPGLVGVFLVGARLLFAL